MFSPPGAIVGGGGGGVRGPLCGKRHGFIILRIAATAIPDTS